MVFVIPDSEFGSRVRARLRDDPVIWLTTTGADGRPQPNPVWFVWEEDRGSVLIYSANEAARLAHIAVRPLISLNFNTAADGEDVVVFAGVTEQALDAPPADQHEEYLRKYDDDIVRIGSNRAKYAADYGVALRVVLTKVRGF